MSPEQNTVTNELSLSQQIESVTKKLELKYPSESLIDGAIIGMLSDEAET